MDQQGLSRISQVLLLLLVCCSLSFPRIQSAPIKYLIETCDWGVDKNVEPLYCCPVLPSRPVKDFVPKFDPSKPLRLRRALQCLDDDELAVYTAKLHKAYSMMRALPDDDPRSLYQQSVFHCAHTANSLSYAGQRLNIHWSWIFHPWHRYYLYFHERIIQSLLQDPTFSFHFWNWDNGGGPDEPGVCSKPGNRIPAIYANTSLAMFYPDRESRALAPSRMLFDTCTSCDPLEDESVVLARNAETIYDGMVMSDTAEKALGKPFRAGDYPTTPNEATGIEYFHGKTHVWIGGAQMDIVLAAVDPIFFAIHGNVERLWEAWRNLGPDRRDFTDLDFLNAEYVFYDENGDLNRVKARDCLDSRNLGYVNEQTSDLSWNANRDRAATIKDPLMSS